MILHLLELRHLGDIRLWVAFDNGESGVVDLTGTLEGEVFEPLNDPDLFSTARLDDLFKTVVWSNGADLAPEYLLDLLHQQREPAKRVA